MTTRVKAHVRKGRPVREHVRIVYRPGVPIDWDLFERESARQLADQTYFQPPAHDAPVTREVTWEDLEAARQRAKRHEFRPL